MQFSLRLVNYTCKEQQLCPTFTANTQKQNDFVKETQLKKHEEGSEVRKKIDSNI